jgi:secreted trypsin-like serine protease
VEPERLQHGATRGRHLVRRRREDQHGPRARTARQAQDPPQLVVDVVPRGVVVRRQPRIWQQDTCKGDSGGPLLIGETLAGVTSGGDPDCLGLLSWDTNVVPFLPWIVSLLR